MTTSCVSVPAPPALPAPPTCAANTTIESVVGRILTRELACPGATRLALVDAPAHGTVAIGLRSFRYVPAAGYQGDDSFTYQAFSPRGTASAVARVTIHMGPKPPAPAAPRLALTGKPPRLGKRVVLRGTCDRACSVTLRLRVTLKGGRNLDGRAVKASAPAGGTLQLTLKRAAIPAHKRILRARVIGVLQGADGRTRIFTLTLRR